VNQKIKMASAYIQLSPGVFWPTFKLRKNTYKVDEDIKNNPDILTERKLYEQRKHLRHEFEKISA